MQWETENMKVSIVDLINIYHDSWVSYWWSVLFYAFHFTFHHQTTSCYLGKKLIHAVIITTNRIVYDEMRCIVDSYIRVELIRKKDQQFMTFYILYVTICNRQYWLLKNRIFTTQRTIINTMSALEQSACTIVTDVRVLAFPFDCFVCMVEVFVTILVNCVHGKVWIFFFIWSSQV